MGERTLGGRYTVQDRIGSGGMATVYRGLDEVLGRTVAIKTMLPQYASDPSFAARFKQEAQAAAALSSPYIVSVYDWGKDNNTYYIVMEYLRGTDLKTGIRKHGALDGKKVAQIGSQIAQALSVAHKHDIIHRDIKPQNIMVQPDGNIKVMDFGIARAKNSHLTTDNSVLGTAHYVSPEQTQGRELGPTTDIYSLGVVMYEAATGQVPFQGDDAITVALKQVNEQPKPPSQLNPNVDPQLEAIILKCMQKRPDDRFQSANELYRVLRDYLAGRTSAVNGATATVRIPAQPTNVAVAPVQPLTNPQGTPTQQRIRTGETRYRQLTATELAEIEEERSRSRRTRNIIIAVLVLLALLAGGAFALSQLMDSGKTYTVPNLLNLTEDQATQRLDQDEHFSVGGIKHSYSDEVAEGYVMEQSPAANRSMPDGTAIDLVVSKGPKPEQTVSVPDLSGKTAEEVTALLNEKGLLGQEGESIFSDDVASGRVAYQTPTAGSIAKAGDTVTYYLSKGVETVEIPDVTGKSEAEARKLIEDADLVFSSQTQTSADVAEGNVISQSPKGGMQAQKGDTITVVISEGTGLATIPNVVGFTGSKAGDMLSDAGFPVITTYDYSDTVPEGVVISQSLSGSAVPGTYVTITVSSGKEPEPEKPAEDDKDTDKDKDKDKESETTPGGTTDTDTTTPSDTNTNTDTGTNTGTGTNTNGN